MQKRYRVFISSTADLKDERGIAIQAVQACDCVPCFMEVWPASKECVVEHIKRQIDLCDFFILLAGNKYGSYEHEGEDRRSYVEIEYEHALTQHETMPILVLMARENATDSATDKDADAQKGFRDKVRRTHTARTWDNFEDLTRVIMASLMKEVLDRESAEVVESNADLIATVAGYVNEQKRFGRKITRAVMIQFSAANAKDILKKLIWSGVDTDVYVATPEIAAGVNQWQRQQAEAMSVVNLRNFLEPLDAKTKLGSLVLHQYNVKGSLRALMLDVEDINLQSAADSLDNLHFGLVAVGAYAYMVRWPLNEEQEDIRGGEMPMTIFRKKHTGYHLVSSMIMSVVGNWKQFGRLNSLSVLPKS